MFLEVRGECEELNNSPQIEAAADGRPLTRYAANSRSNDAARRVWRLGWRVPREAAPWEPTRSKIATSRRSGLGYQESLN